MGGHLISPTSVPIVEPILYEKDLDVAVLYYGRRLIISSAFLQSTLLIVVLLPINAYNPSPI
jgi:hypothetical protein